MRRRTPLKILRTALALPVLAVAGALPVLLAPGAAHAQAPQLEPLPPPPPPPPGINDNSEPSIDIGPRPEDKVEKVTMNGENALKVTTPQGRVYYLVPSPAASVGTQGPTPNHNVPQWVIKQF